jgi:hypothetical protein
MRSYSLIFCLFISFFGFSQIQKRIEFPTNFKDETFKVINLKEGGVLVLSHQGKSELLIEHYSQDLEKQWSNKIVTTKNTEYIDHIIENSTAYLLLTDERSGQFFSVKVSYNIGLTQAKEYSSFPNFSYSTFQVNEGNLVIGGSVKKDPVLLFYSEAKKAPKIISGGFKKQALIQSITHNGDDNSLIVSFLVNEKKKNILAYRIYNVAGNLINQKQIQPKENYTFLNGNAYPTATNGITLVGNFGFSNNVRDGVAISQGLFIAFENGETNYYTFSELKNFFQYLNDKQAEKIEKQIKKKKEKGSDIRWTYRMLVNKVIPEKDGLLLAADMFSPIIRYNNNYGYGFGGLSPLMGYRSYFNYYNYRMYGLNSWALNPWYSGNSSQTYIDGFRYSHGILIKFDTDGKIKWDNSVVYNNLQSQQLTTKLAATVEDGKVYTAYSKANDIFATVYDKNGNQLETSKISVSYPTFDAKDTFNEDVEHWYESYYIGWGYQRGAEQNSSNKRVFYISKLKVGETH